MTASDQPHQHSGIGAVGLMDVLRGMLRNRKKLILASTLLFAALGYLVIALASPIYTASSQVIVEYEETPYTRTGISAQAPAQRQITDRDVLSQVEVIRSPDLALKVLRKLNLIGTPEFDPLKRGLGPLSRLKIMLGFSPDPRRQTPEQRALRVWEKRLKVYNLPNTRVIVIEYDSSSPRTAAAVANTLAEFYIEQTRSTRLAQTGEARAWLRQQIDKLRRKVVEAEKAVESYRARAGLFQGVQSKLHNQELSELSAQIVRAAAERSQAEAKAKAIRRLLKQGRVENSADVLNSRLIQRLREQQAQIRRRQAELSTIYLDNHPRVRAVRREMADLKRQINAEARKIAESLEQQARIAAAREAELRARQAKLKARVSAASQDEVKLRELEREAKAQRSLLESFLARYTDALTRDNAQALPGMARIISRAIPPATPSFPRTGPIMLLSVLAGLVLGLGLAFILEVMAAVQRAEDMAYAPTSTPSVVAQPTAPQSAAPQSSLAQPSVEQPQPPVEQQATPSAGANAATGVAETVDTAAASTRAESARRPASDNASGMQARMASVLAGTGEVKGSSDAASAQGAATRPYSSPSGITTITAATTAAATTAAATTEAAGAAAATAAAEAKTVATTAAETTASAPTPARAEADASKDNITIADAAYEQLRRWLEEEDVQLVALADLGLDGDDNRDIVLHAARALAGNTRVMLLDVADPVFRLLPEDCNEQVIGLGELLAGKAGFADIVRADAQQTRLHLATAGKLPLRTSGEAGRTLRQLLQALRESYDLVLLHEGLPRYPLQEEESLLPLAEAALILCNGEECETAETFSALLRDKFSLLTAVISADAPGAAAAAVAAAAVTEEGAGKADDATLPA